MSQPRMATAAASSATDTVAMEKAAKAYFKAYKEDPARTTIYLDKPQARWVAAAYGSET